MDTSTPTTTRKILYPDDGEQIHISTSAESGDQDPEYLEKYGVDVPDELIAEQGRLYAEWAEWQKRLEAWFETIAPDVETRAEQFRSVALYQSRTWAQYEALPSCEHSEAVMKLHQLNMSSRCDRCGSHINWRHERNPATGMLEPTAEIHVI